MMFFVVNGVSFYYLQRLTGCGDVRQLLTGNCRKSYPE
jgi:hypothetical protein